MDRNVLNSLITQNVPRLKASMPFLKMARDNFDTNPIVSYWALMYVLETGIKSGDQNDELRMLLVTIMPWLEQEKVLRKDDPLFASESAAKDFITGYADQIVTRAEDELNNPQTDASTCTKLFLTASNVYKLLSLFGDLSDDVQQRMKYAKWRAVSLYRDGKPGAGEDSGGPKNPNHDQQPSDLSTGQTNSEGANSATTPPPLAGNPPPVGFFEAPTTPIQGGPADSSDHQQPQPHLPPSSNDNSTNILDLSSPTEAKPQPSFRAPSAEHTSQNVAGIDCAKISSLVSSNDLRRAELLCESSLCAIKDKDIQAAISGLKDTLAALKITCTIKQTD